MLVQSISSIESSMAEKSVVSTMPADAIPGVPSCSDETDHANERASVSVEYVCNTAGDHSQYWPKNGLSPDKTDASA